MRCLHCSKEIHATTTDFGTAPSEAAQFVWHFTYSQCPGCKNLHLWRKRHYHNGKAMDGSAPTLIYPHKGTRNPVPAEVPEPLATDYREACEILTDCPRASAALSRRCLQWVLREKAGVRKSDLVSEIQEAIDSKKLSPALADALDTLRNLSNLAANSAKNKNSGEIMDVLPGEAEWSLDVLEQLFQYFFVQPAILEKKKTDLNLKLTSLGKVPMK